MKRRRFLAVCSLAAAQAYADVRYPAVERGTALAFPRDHGSHPAFRTEWWYVTGWVRDARGRDFGIQVTFFRSRPGVAEESGSTFAPTELLFAHAAVADPALGRLRRDERAARAGFGLAQASQSTTDLPAIVMRRASSHATSRSTSRSCRNRRYCCKASAA